VLRSTTGGFQPGRTNGAVDHVLDFVLDVRGNQSTPEEPEFTKSLISLPWSTLQYRFRLVRSQTLYPTELRARGADEG